MAPFWIVIINILVSGCSSWLWLSESYSCVFQIILCKKICELASFLKAHFCHSLIISEREKNRISHCQLSYLFTDGDLDDAWIWFWKPQSRATSWYKNIYDYYSERFHLFLPKQLFRSLLSKVSSNNIHIFLLRSNFEAGEQPNWSIQRYLQ